MFLFSVWLCIAVWYCIALKIMLHVRPRYRHGVHRNIRILFSFHFPHFLMRTGDRISNWATTTTKYSQRLWRGVIQMATVNVEAAIEIIFPKARYTRQTSECVFIVTRWDFPFVWCFFFYWRKLMSMLSSVIQKRKTKEKLIIPQKLKSFCSQSVFGLCVDLCFVTLRMIAVNDSMARPWWFLSQSTWAAFYYYFCYYDYYCTRVPIFM